MEWIKVQDGMPGKMDKYIIYGSYAKDCPKSVFEAMYDPKGRCFRTDIKAKNVTHWMPLPEPPAE